MRIKVLNLKKGMKRQQWPRRRRCRIRKCRRWFLSWGAARCPTCVRHFLSSRSLKRKERRKRPGSAPSRGVGWGKVRAAVSGGCCAICGAPTVKSVAHHCDHILPLRFVVEHKLGDPHAQVNIVLLCQKCHPKKRRAEDKLCNRTNIVGWLQELNRIGFPMERVKKAMEFYGMR